MKEQKYPSLPGSVYYSAFDALWAHSFYVDPPIFRIEVPYVDVEKLTNKLKNLSFSLLPELYITVYGESFNGVFFRLMYVTTVESLFRVRKVLKILHYSSIDLLDVITVCPKSYKEIVDNPEFFSSADVKDLLSSRLKFLSYRQYLVWELCRKKYYKYERDKYLKMTWVKSTAK